MKTFVFAALLLCSVAAFAQLPKSAGYPLTVHVSRSYLVHSGGGKNEETYQMLDVLVNGKKLELGAVYRYGLIPLGDYKAKLKKNQMEHGHYLRQQYELLFEDNSRETFDLVGERE